MFRQNVENVVSKKLDCHRTSTEVHMYSDRGTHVLPTEVRMYPDRGTHTFRPKRDDFQIFLTSLLGFKGLIGTVVFELIYIKIRANA